MSWPQIALAVASAAMQKSAQSDMEDRQNSLANRMTEYQSKKAAEGRAATEKYVGTLTPGERAAQLAEEQAKLKGGYDQALSSAQQMETPIGTSGKVSKDFTDRVASNKSATSQRVSALAQALAAMGAGGQREMASGRNYLTAAGTVDGANSASNNVSRYYMDSIKNQRPDATMSLLSQIAGGASMASGGSDWGSMFSNPTSIPKSLADGTSVAGGFKPELGVPKLKIPAWASTDFGRV